MKRADLIRHLESHRCLFVQCRAYPLSQPCERFGSASFKTPKAFANLSPRFEQRENPGLSINICSTLKGFALPQTLSGLNRFLNAIPGLSLRSNPGLKLANGFGVISN